MVKTMTEADQAEEELVEVFREFDVNKDGEVNWQDLLKVFSSMGYSMDEKEAQEIIHFFDSDGDGSINFAEFVKIMMYDTSDQSLFEQAGDLKN